jgi:hypothetical protein
VADLQDIEFCLDLRNLVFELLLPFGKGVVLRTKPVLVDHPRLIQVVELVDLGEELLALPF